MSDEVRSGVLGDGLLGSVYDVAIVGAGPAGLTAAIYACRAGEKVTVFEKLVAGGQIINTPRIENYPATPGITGAEWAQTLAKQAEDLGAEMIFEEVLGIEKSDGHARFGLKTEGGEYFAQNVIIATGLVEKKLKIPGEEKYLGRGVSYCATCDGAFYRGKTVAVIGGGNSALSSATYLAGIAEKIYLIHRRTEYRADQILQEKIAKLKNVVPVLGYVPVEITGEEKVEKIKLKSSSEARDLVVDGVFVAIGHEPKNELLKDLAELDENGYAITDEKCRTKTEGLFVVGDGRQKELRQLVTAVADGAIAASQI